MTIQSLEFKDLSFGYTPNHLLFNKISFQFPLGENVWVQSAGGHGKSALLKILMGLLNPTSGDYLINGESTVAMSFGEFQKYRLTMAFGFDMGGLMNNRTLRDNLMLPLLFHNRCSHAEALHRADHMLYAFDVHDGGAILPASVSGSKRKCAVLARALILHPETLFLDDPTTGLSPEQVDVLVSFIRAQRGHGTLKNVFVTTRDEHFLKAIKPTCIWLDKNGIRTKPITKDVVAA